VQDELDQLEKMYEADDLTEETEEIVLKRSRNQVDFAKFSLESTKLNVDEILNVRLPRNDIRIKESLDRAELNLARAKTALAVDLNKARYELEKQKQARTKSLDRHVKLLADRDLMEIKAPVDGVVYYGQCIDGNWADMAAMIKKLEPHNSVSSGTVFMTIVDPRPMHVLAVAGEEKRPDLAVGQTTKITPPADASEPLAGKVASVSTVPVASGKFAVDFDLTGSELPEWIVPGVSCKLKVTTYDKSDALAVPKKAVHTDEEDEDVKYAWLVDPDDADARAQRRDVKTGKTSGDDVEVLKGLKQGDVISLEDESKKGTEE
jgi:multidrug efflux pump subunit AcrA (membrane-fusion protein)